MNAERIIGMAWSEGRDLSPAAKAVQQFIFDYFDKQQPS